MVHAASVSLDSTLSAFQVCVSPHLVQVPGCLLSLLKTHNKSRGSTHLSSPCSLGQPGNPDPLLTAAPTSVYVWGRGAQRAPGTFFLKFLASLHPLGATCGPGAHLPAHSWSCSLRLSSPSPPPSGLSSPAPVCFTAGPPLTSQLWHAFPRPRALWRAPHVHSVSHFRAVMRPCESYYHPLSADGEMESQRLAWVTELVRVGIGI